MGTREYLDKTNDGLRVHVIGFSSSVMGAKTLIHLVGKDVKYSVSLDSFLSERFEEAVHSSERG